jgi:hypothetical protein
MPSRRRLLSSGGGLATALGLAGCGSTSAGSPRAGGYTSKVELGLNIAAIPDWRTRHAAYRAAADIEETILLLGHSRLTPEEIATRLEWQSNLPLLLSRDDPPYIDQKYGTLRRAYVFMAARSWALHPDGTLSFVARFSSVATRDYYDETQRYESRNCRWRLIRQERQKLGSAGGGRDD